MINKEIKIAFEEYQHIDELPPADKTLCLEAVKALATSHSPYSEFRVGVANAFTASRHRVLSAGGNSSIC